MPYENVPQRLLDGEAVPRSEVIGYAKPIGQVQTDLVLHYMVQLFILARSFDDGVMTYQITAFGQWLRQEFVKRIDGDCPEIP